MRNTIQQLAKLTVSATVLASAFLVGPAMADEDGVLRAIDSGLKLEDLLVSAAAKDLLGRLVCVDPSKRLSAADALAHSWFTGAA